MDFRLKADAMALQWLKRFRSDSCAKWKTFFHNFYRVFLYDPVTSFKLGSTLFNHTRCSRLMTFYKHLVEAWRKLHGGIMADSRLALGIERDAPLKVASMSTQSAYRIGLAIQHKPQHCVTKFHPTYSELHGPETWHQLSYLTLDRTIGDLNWKIAHGVLYTASRLVRSFGYCNVDPRCHWGADEEMLVHLFFKCSFAQFLINWV